MAFIYKVTNNINGKMYIGKTEYDNPEKRWKDHIRDRKKERTNKRPFYDALNKYGPENFTFAVIEETDNPIEREKYYINKYRTYVGFDDCNGYNATLGGDGKPYLNLDKNEVINYHIYEALYTTAETAEHFCCTEKTIKKILDKYNIPHNTLEIANMIRYYLQTGGIAQIDITTKKILEIYINGKDIERYSNYETPFNAKTISCACESSNKTHYAYGYLWYYVRDIPDDIWELNHRK